MVVLARPIGKRHVQRIAVIIIFTLAWVWIAAVAFVVWHTATSTKSIRRVSGLSIQDPLHHQLAGDEPDENMEQPQGLIEKELELTKYESPTLIFTCQRAAYLDQTLADVMKYVPKSCDIGCPIIVSQDGDDEEVKRVILKYQSQKDAPPILHIQHQKPAHVHIQVNPYEALAVHYGWALKETFSGNAYHNNDYPLPRRVIILEEDIHVAPDFFDFFKATAPLLDTDSTLMGVSAFNDNGIGSNVQDASRVVRSDFFSGLGWMINKSLWDSELSSKWPTGYWDDWLREPEQRHDRHFLRPEISRSFHFGVRGGASNNQFGGALSKIVLNQEKIDWKHEDLTYLYPATFDNDYWNLISSAKLESDIKVAKEESKLHNVRVEYTNFVTGFKRAASQLSLMDDEKAGVPRTAYKGVVESRPYRKHFLFITPPLNTLRKVLHQSR